LITFVRYGFPYDECFHTANFNRIIPTEISGQPLEVIPNKPGETNLSILISGIFGVMESTQMFHWEDLLLLQMLSIDDANFAQRR